MLVGAKVDLVVCGLSIGMLWRAEGLKVERR